MIVRLLNMVIIGALIAAAAYVYRIKLDSTVQAEHLAKLRIELRHERDTIAALRAQWSQLDNPVRIEALAKRYLQLRPITPTQFDSLDRLPERPTQDAHPNGNDPVGAMIENFEVPDTVTGTVPAANVPLEGGTLAPADAAAPPDDSDDTQPPITRAAPDDAAAAGAPSQ